jgi:uncharacterized protein YjlB
MSAGVETMTLERNGYFPNSELPVLVYRGAVAQPVTAEAVKAVFARNDWPPQWVDTIFTYHHFHSTAHETLGVASGWAKLTLGGPGGRVVEIEAGDVIVIPAGVAHKLEESGGDFAVVGAYPPGQDWDILKGEEGEWDMAMQNLARVPLPRTDPLEGAGGNLPNVWGKE